MACPRYSSQLCKKQHSVEKPTARFIAEETAKVNLKHILEQPRREDLRGLRELLGKTQEELAALLERSQSQVSETERRQDVLLSTLRSYVKALGGELEVIANFGDKRIRLHSA